MIDTTPSYLSDYRDLYRQDPREAARAWFRDAKYGLFMHYGLYSLVGRHEWVQLRELIPVAEYAKLAEQFTADKFDAMAIAEFAKAAGMKYVNLTTRHHDGFCLFNSSEWEFTSAKAPAQRDLVGELAVACEVHGLGLCLYYSHGRDWKHPHAPDNADWGGSARPKYDPPEASYAYGEEHDLQQYLDFMSAQIRELLTNYGPVAAIWLDGIAVPLSGDKAKFRCQELYDMVHDLQPQVLVAYKQGLLGTEDFFAPEHRVPKASDNPRHVGELGDVSGKLMEICTTMAPGSWGYKKDTTGSHLSEDDVWAKLKQAGADGANLLLNTGPLPDGSLDEEDVRVLLAIGQRLEREGFPS
ncbi:MAG: alpha-L-fucosidase precursor [Victivallales bacterium]|nr:alpha-L-fucosidase precursor [Victivallales bacterium]MBT7301684.1 alpha-L-fucosidase precursor [Victivallales bacterium]